MTFRKIRVLCSQFHDHRILVNEEEQLFFSLRLELFVRVISRTFATQELHQLMKKRLKEKLNIKHLEKLNFRICPGSRKNLEKC